MAISAVGGAEPCAVCDKIFNSLDPSTYPPTCSKECWLIWTKVVNHKGESCWIPGCIEVFCGIRTPGYCVECEVFKIEEEIKKRGLNKNDLIGNY